MFASHKVDMLRTCEACGGCDGEEGEVVHENERVGDEWRERGRNNALDTKTTRYTEYRFGNINLSVTDINLDAAHGERAEEKKSYIGMAIKFVREQA